MKLLMGMKRKLLIESFQCFSNGVHLLFVHRRVWVEGKLIGLLGRVLSVERRSRSPSLGCDNRLL